MGLGGGFNGNAVLGRDRGLGLVSATKKKKPGAARASDLVTAASFAASGCLTGVAVVSGADFFIRGRTAQGRWDSQLEDGYGLGHGGDGGLGLTLQKSEPKASRGFALAGAASSSAAAGFSFCCTTSALSQPSRIARRHSTR